MYFIREFKANTELSSIKNIWTEMYEDNKELTPFQSYEWNRCLIEHKIYKGKLKLLVLYKDEKPVMIAPLTIRNNILCKEISFLGEFTHSDYLNFIYNRELTFEDFKYFISNILENSAIYRFSNINETSFLINYLNQLTGTCELNVRKGDYKGICVKIPLCETEEEYFQKLSKKTKRMINYRRNKILESSCEVKYDFYNSETLPKELIKEIIDLYCISQKEKYKKKIDEKYKNYLIEAIKENSENMVLGTCLVDGKLASFHLGMKTHQKDICGMVCAINKSYSEFDVGNLLLYNLICHLIRENNNSKKNGFQYRYYDLTRGNEAYKYKFGGVEHYNYDFTILKNSKLLKRNEIAVSVKVIIFKMLKNLNIYGRLKNTFD